MEALEKPSTLRQVASSPLYLGAAIAMFLSGLGTSAAAPQIVLFLVKELDMPMAAAGLFYLTNLAAPLAGYAIGSFSDRTGDRLGLFRLCALLGFFGWAGIALSSSSWMPFVLNTFVLAFSGAAASQLFAAIHDDIESRATSASDDIVSTVRMALTAGWVIGPVVGTWITAQFGVREMLWFTSLCFLLQIPPLGTLATRPLSEGTVWPEKQRRERNLKKMLPLLGFTGLFVLVYAGESIKYGFLLLYMDESLGLDAATRGAVIGIQPLVELLIMPFSVLLARKTGMLWLMCFAAALGVLANICFSTWSSVMGMFAGQILMGGVWGVFAALGIIAAQRLLPSAVATASAIFMSSTALSSALGGAAGGLGVTLLGLPHVFFLPAVFSTVAVVGLACMARSMKLM
ncbi:MULTISPECIES: MFS transporter [unclassified Rhizobium]|uniref:MFS transporter n=1 Tax=unclassified Rhizobium TaxID=2613769 RepID=UPI000BE88721|nr:MULTISPECIES: MFS transporter [unclassified Rhizobium]MDF0661685.1 MFS transporter [Rhizobium sp. BC49]PDS87515.1 MFS transporter [Rhizobium sp. L18]